MLFSKTLKKIFTKGKTEISKDGKTPLIGRIFKTKKGYKISNTKEFSLLE